jgi:hypothetical protein
MKTLGSLLIVVTILILASCGKDDEKSDRFNYLTDAVWLSDSLLMNGIDASGPGQPLEPFKGQAVFRKDGTGDFGAYSGTWRFAQNETELVINSDSLDFPLATQIAELTAISLKVTTTFPNFFDPQNPLFLRLTFKAQ